MFRETAVTNACCLGCALHIVHEKSSFALVLEDTVESWVLSDLYWFGLGNVFVEVV